ncbi:MAG TPA: response regulator transcription factor [Thermodesulfobacteriota bacterium]|nr:response regulator transcription factor [Thermodesulfobacteriota bacterium]
MEIGKKQVISLIVAASSALYREGIRRILEPEKDIEIIAEASTQIGIIQLVEQKKPDVLFIDAAIPNLDIVKILELIKEKSSETKVLLLLHMVDEKVIIDAISLGVRGYLTDLSKTEQLIQAIRTIRKDEIWAQRKIITKALTRTLYSEKGKPKPLQLNLTQREEQIVELVIQGYSNKKIANKLSLSEKTIKNRLGGIFRKLGISSRLQLAIHLFDRNDSQ